MSRHSPCLFPAIVAGFALVNAGPGAALRAQSPDGAEAGPASTAGGRTAIVDVVRVFDECDQIKDLNAMMRQENESYQREADARKKQLEQKEVELSAFSPDSPDYPPRRREFTQLSIEANVWLQAKRSELQRDFFNWTRVVYEEFLKACSEVAKERGFTLVLLKREFKPELITDENVDTLRQFIQNRTVVYADESLDITEAVIKKMNARYRERGARTRSPVPGVKSP